MQNKPTYFIASPNVDCKIFLFAGLLLGSFAVHADREAPPRSYSAVTENENFEFFMQAKKGYARHSEYDEKRQSGLYQLDLINGKKVSASTPLWTVDWYARNVIPHSNGENLVRLGPWASHISQLAVAFYHNGVEIAEYSIDDLILDETNLEYSVSHFSWRKAVDYNETQETLSISTVEGATYVFSTLTGKLESTSEYQITDFDELDKRIIGSPADIQFASREILGDHPKLLYFLMIDGSTMYYLPDDLRNNKSFVSRAVRINGEAYKHLPEKYKKDRSIMLAAATASNSPVTLQDFNPLFEFGGELAFTELETAPLSYWDESIQWDNDLASYRIAVGVLGLSAYASAHPELRGRTTLVEALKAEHKLLAEDLPVLKVILELYEMSINSDFILHKLAPLTDVPKQLLNQSEVHGELRRIKQLLVEYNDPKLSAGIDRIDSIISDNELSD